MAPDSIVWLAERSGALLLIAALGTGMGTLFSRSRAWRAIAASILVGLSLVPVGTVSGLTFLYSVVGPLSLATIVGCAVYIGSHLRLVPALARHDLLYMAVVVAVLGLVLYPASMGLLRWEPYRMGFHGIWLPTALIVIAAAAAAMRSIIVPLWIAASAAAWQSSLFDSTNLWDYVIDPVVWIASLVFLAVAAVRRIKHRSRAGARRPVPTKGTSYFGNAPSATSSALMRRA
jgi:hypothetical protein